MKLLDTSAAVVYGAADRFVDAALRHDDSIFTAGVEIWTKTNLDDLHARFVAKQLGKYGIRSTKLRIGGAVVQGYSLRGDGEGPSLWDAFQRYCAPTTLPDAEHPEHPEHLTAPVPLVPDVLEIGKVQEQRSTDASAPTTPRPNRSSTSTGAEASSDRSTHPRNPTQ